MARYDKEHKHLSRERIVEAAGRRFKTDGIDGSGVAVLMKDAGLTNGAFYGHFESKDDLVGTALREELRRQREVLTGLAPGPAGLEQFLRAYLSVEHRDDRGGGCPTAALLDEIGRCTDTTRQSYSDGILGIIDDLAARLEGVPRRDARVAVLGLFASMVGTMQFSRALTDRRMATAVLEQGIQNGLALIRSALPATKASTR
jgi:TetR/AcrR family transcriptional regulator, transcriptional repressor for nem operon